MTGPGRLRPGRPVARHHAMPPIWNAYADTPFPWERDALEFVRERFPEREPYRAWSLFVFVALDGSVNEVDLLVFAPYGFFLIEIKSRPGRVTGDAGTWTWHTDGRLTSTDNPLKLANTKAKKLAKLLAEQPAAKRGGRIPFIEPLIFLSAPCLQCDLTGTCRLRVCLRDREASDAGPAWPGIMAAIRRRECAGLEALSGRAQLDRPTAKLVARAMEQAGIVASNRERRVSDYRLTRQIDEGRNYQDWLGSHVALSETKRRIRIYRVRPNATEEVRRTDERAAIREFQLLENLQSPGVLRAVQFTGHDLGPAVIFEHDPAAAAGRDPLFMEAAEVFTGDVAFDPLALVTSLVADESVPLLPVLRYKPSGLRKHTAWQEVWALQRKEDAIDARTSLPPSDPLHLTPEQAQDLKRREVGEIPVPPKYTSADFLKPAFWRLRGKLDVPKERFTSFPGILGQDGTLVIAWAGLDHLQLAKAIGDFHGLVQTEYGGSDDDRLIPLLANLAELIPWVEQWPPNPLPAYAGPPADFYTQFIRDESASRNLTSDHLRTWQAPATAARGRKRQT